MRFIIMWAQLLSYTLISTINWVPNKD